MKSTVMSYLDNLIARGDNLFSTESREALSEATLLYVTPMQFWTDAECGYAAAHGRRILRSVGAQLDEFANAMVDIENVIGGAGSSGRQ